MNKQKANYNLIYYLEYQRDIFNYLDSKVYNLQCLDQKDEDLDHVYFTADNKEVKVNMLWWINFELNNKPEWMLAELTDFIGTWRMYLTRGAYGNYVWVDGY